MALTLAEPRFEQYEFLLRRWQKAVNLVSTNTLDQFRPRHIDDSAQLYPFLKEIDGPIADFGSGAGFPGLVLAMMGIPHIELVESDTRKCVFLQTVARETGVNVTVRNQRIEALPPHHYAAVISRACASLESLVAMAYPALHPTGACYFLKGRGAAEELAQARVNWHFDAVTHPARTGDGAVLEIRHIQLRSVS